MPTTAPVTRTDLAATLLMLAASAKRFPHVVGHHDWDAAHARLDRVLTAWQKAND